MLLTSSDRNGFSLTPLAILAQTRLLTSLCLIGFVKTRTDSIIWTTCASLS